MTAVDSKGLAKERPRTALKGQWNPIDFLPIAVIAGLLALVPLFFSDSKSMMTVVTTGLLFASYGVAFNIIFGSTGQLFLCVGALAGIGGYTSAILSDRLGVPMLISMLIAGAAAAAIGGLLSWVAVSRSLDTIFTGIVTLAFSLSYESFIIGKGDLTGGENGLPITAGSGTLLRDTVKPFYMFLGLLVLYLVAYRIIQRSHVGWAFKALKDDEVAAELAGVDVTRYRVYAGIIGSLMLGIAGALFAHYRGFIGDTTYSFGAVDVRTLVMLSFGGIGTLLGPVIGAVVFTVLDELLDSYAQLREVLYGIITIVLFLGFRRGLVPAITSRLKKRL